MQSIHVTAYMVRNTRGHYEKTTGNEGIGYVMFHTKAAAQDWVQFNNRDDCFVVKVRTAITPVDSGRTERLVALREARSKAISAKRKVEHNFYP